MLPAVLMVILLIILGALFDVWRTLGKVIVDAIREFLR